jgi:glycosyltransferase involved in cell wall biosynthesis
MKVLLIIDHFGPGGAQRQMVELACGMKRRGHEVEMFVYFPEHNFFRPLLEEHRIIVHQYAKGRGFSFGALARLISLLRIGRFDIAASYLSSANIYAELAVLFAGGSKLVVSERTSHHDDKSPIRDHLRRAMHGLSDKVVANSRTHCDWLKRKWWLKKKAACIYNGINLQRFRPEQGAAESVGDLRLIGIGRIGPEKNILNLIAALSVLQAESCELPQVSWAGLRDESELGRRYCRQIDETLEALPEMRRRWHWLGVQGDVPGLLRHHHALIHPSLYEGLPNVVCEALATGVPVLASDVCDHSLLVADGERGFLFDPRSPQSIAAAITKFRTLSVDDRCRFSRNAREYAEENLGVEKMISAYEFLFEQLMLNRSGRDFTACW